ncbi:Pr6Pr family membrane protein [Streptantibioticus cattleyicolor]|uniref:Pr6Pr family membrane protein n=1 Tax=Streptantibioticus cattleyicolor TaxID=29303 RepID=UPI000213FCC9
MPDERAAVTDGRRIAFRGAACAAGVAGLVGTTAQSLSQPGPAEFWIYFTFQSNLLLAVFFGVLVGREVRGAGEPGPFLRGAKGAVTLYILITGLVFNLLLANPASPFYTVQKDSHYLWYSVLLHVVAPVMALLDWLMFGPRGSLRWRHAAMWLAYPLAYLAFALIRGAVVTTGTLYPYPFLDVAKSGYGQVTVNCCALAVAFWLLGVGLVALDRRAAGRGGDEVAVAEDVPAPTAVSRRR